MLLSPGCDWWIYQSQFIVRYSNSDRAPPSQNVQTRVGTRNWCDFSVCDEWCTRKMHEKRGLHVSYHHIDHHNHLLKAEAWNKMKLLISGDIFQRNNILRIKCPLFSNVLKYS